MMDDGDFVRESILRVLIFVASILTRFSPAKLHGNGHFKLFAVEVYAVAFAKPSILYIVVAVDMVNDDVYVIVNWFVCEFNVMPYPTGSIASIAVTNDVAL
jgi:hypothetical protein